MQNDIPDHELYLYFSYIPRFTEVDPHWLSFDFDHEFGKEVDDKSWWVQEGIKALKDTMADEVASTPGNAMHVVLLSGGLDSRAILGSLLDILPKSQIVAATYGMPGTWDYEIARGICKKFGIQHEVFNLLEEKWEADSLLKAAQRLTLPISVYQSYVRQKVNQHFGNDHVYWSGFFGDAIAGWGLPEIPNTDKHEAVMRFIHIEPTPNYKDLAFKKCLIEKILVEFPWDRFSHTKFNLDQLLVYYVKERFLLQPILIVNGFLFKTPFTNKRWLNFMNNAPYEWRLQRALYKQIIYESFKELSRLPTETAAGSPFYASKPEVLLRRVIARIQPYIFRYDPYRSHPRTNYLNWTEALRYRGRFQDLVYSTLQDLRERALLEGHEIDAWWQEHLTRKKNNSVLIMNLSSLEFLLKAGVMLEEYPVSPIVS